MSDFFKGITFANQNVSPVDDAILRRRLLSDGVLTGCELTYAGYTLTMASGYLIACGRQIRRPTAENWAISDATSGYARVLMTIDLTRTATEEVFDQINTSIEYATSKDGFPALIQDDINATGSKYQVVLAIVSLGTGGITGIASCLAPARSYGSNYNLLDNSDFRNPVNQRGISTTQSLYTFGYTIDRWRIYGGTDGGESGIRLTDNGVTISLGGSGAYFDQLLHLDVSKTYTFVAETDDGIYLVSGVPSTGCENAMLKLKTNGDGYLRCAFINISKEHNIHWAALYEGEFTAETLPEYRPKGYGTELLECQRYYQVRSANNIAAVDMRPMMRLSSPTITSVTGGYAYSADL